MGGLGSAGSCPRRGAAVRGSHQGCRRRIFRWAAVQQTSSPGIRNAHRGLAGKRPGFGELLTLPGPAMASPGAVPSKLRRFRPRADARPMRHRRTRSSGRSLTRVEKPLLPELVNFGAASTTVRDSSALFGGKAPRTGERTGSKPSSSRTARASLVQGGRM